MVIAEAGFVQRDRRGPVPADEWIDVAAAAERHHCSTKTIWRRSKQRGLPARTEKVSGRDGRPVPPRRHYFPDHLGDRFPRKAEMPSFPSSDKNALANPSFSASMP